MGRACWTKRKTTATNRRNTSFTWIFSLRDRFEQVQPAVYAESVEIERGGRGGSDVVLCRHVQPSEEIPIGFQLKEIARSTFLKGFRSVRNALWSVRNRIVRFLFQFECHAAQLTLGP